MLLELKWKDVYALRTAHHHSIGRSKKWLAAGLLHHVLQQNLLLQHMLRRHQLRSHHWIDSSRCGGCCVHTSRGHTRRNLHPSQTWNTRQNLWRYLFQKLPLRHRLDHFFGIRVPRFAFWTWRGDANTRFRKGPAIIITRNPTIFRI